MGAHHAVQLSMLVHPLALASVPVDPAGFPGANLGVGNPVYLANAGRHQAIPAGGDPPGQARAGLDQRVAAQRRSSRTSLFSSTDGDRPISVRIVVANCLKCVRAAIRLPPATCARSSAACVDSR